MQKVKPEQKSSHKSLSKTIYRRETGHFYGDQESADLSFESDFYSENSDMTIEVSKKEFC